VARRRLLRNKAFVAMLAARGVSLAGDQVATIALVLLVSRDHPATAVGGLLLAESLPWLLSPFAGAIVDRVEKRRLMIGCQIGQGVIFAAITAWLPPYAALLVLIAAASALGTALRAANQTSLPPIVEEADLLPANALLGVAANLAIVLGPAIGGALAGLAGSRLALGVDAATFFLSSAFLLRLPVLPPHPSGGEPVGALRSTRDGLRYSFGDPILRALLISSVLLIAFAGVDNVALVYLIRETFGAGAFAYGAGTACFGIGMITATLILVRLGQRNEVRVLVAGNVATGVGTGLTGAMPVLGGVYPMQAIAGVGNALEVAAQNTLIQRRSEPAMLGRVSGASNAVVGLGFLFAYVGGGAVVEATSPRAAFVIAGIGSLLAIAVLLPLLRDPGAVSPPADREVASAPPPAIEENPLV
jgi:MFS family permease